MKWIKNINRMKWNDKVFFLVVCIVAVFVLAGLAKSATEDIREHTFTAAEQIEVITFEYGIAIDSFTSIAGTASDSSDAGDSTNWQFVVTYDSTKYTRWLLKVLYANETEIVPVWRAPVFPPVSASAVISLADKQEIGGYANDSVTIHHGAGAYDGASGPVTGFSITVFTVDTSAAPDDSLSDIPVSVYNQTGALVASSVTLSDGAAALRLNAGTYTMTAGTNVTRWAFDDSIIVVTALDTFGIQGYESTPDPSPGPGLAPIWADVVGILGNEPLSGVIVTLRFGKTTNVTASAVTYGSVVGYDTTDVGGRFSFDAPLSAGLTDTVLYIVTGEYQKQRTFSIDSLFNPVGGVNLTDSIAGR